MAAKKNNFGDDIFIGADVGGTKILVGAVNRKGKVLFRHKQPTPSPAKARDIYQAIEDALILAVEEVQGNGGEIRAIGLGIPGLIDVTGGEILATPNIDFAGFPLAAKLEKKFKVPARLGNDVNLGLLGEQWLGAARKASDAVGIFLGTGVGGAVMTGGRLMTGWQGGAAELGHMTIVPGGESCTCGKKGCLEAYAGRWAIERDIRRALKQGGSSVIAGQIASEKIRSRFLKEGLQKKDKLVTGIMAEAAQKVGEACLSFKHIFNPEVFVLGGGVVEACSDFILPVVKKILRDDPFFKDLAPCKVREAELGDDAVLLGAAALVLELGEEPKSPPPPEYPSVVKNPGNSIRIDNETYREDVCVRADGSVRMVKEKMYESAPKFPLVLGPRELSWICKKNPEDLFLGSVDKLTRLTADAREYAASEKINISILPLKEALQAFRACDKRKALFAHITPAGQE